jgi:hypothetical protein
MRRYIFILAAMLACFAPHAEAVYTPLPDLSESFTTEAPVAAPEPDYFIEAVCPLGQADDGDFIDIAVLVEAETHTRVVCIVKSPLGLEGGGLGIGEWLESERKKGTFERLPSVILRRKYGDVAYERARKKLIRAKRQAARFHVGHELADIGILRLGHGLYLELPIKKVQVGPLAVKADIGYSHAFEGAIEKRKEIDETFQKFKLAAGLYHGEKKKLLVLDLFGLEREAKGLPRRIWTGRRLEYTEIGIPYYQDVYRLQSVPEYLREAGAEWELTTPELTIPISSKGLELSPTEWKLSVSGSIILFKGEIGLSLSELMDILQKTGAYIEPHVSPEEIEQAILKGQ